MNDYRKIYDAVLEGDDEAALEEAESLLEAGSSPLDIINDGLITAMEEVGRLFKADELFIPEVMMSAQTVAGVIDILKPMLSGENSSRGTVVIGTVKGDIHDIGKNLVALLLSSNGYTVRDLGNDVDPEEFVSAAQEHKAQIVALSALLTTTMINMDATVDAFAQAGLRDDVRIIIGGAPVDQDYADEIGADGYADDAQGAVELANNLLGV
ncbi:MAG: corrinoid protein [Firmicutes bacterium]|nr:corrinoid protein [Bacillota bacterium]